MAEKSNTGDKGSREQPLNDKKPVQLMDPTEFKKAAEAKPVEVKKTNEDRLVLRSELPSAASKTSSSEGIGKEADDVDSSNIGKSGGSAEVETPVEEPISSGA
ncbi:hypothetical protein IL306_008524 [Fusarium sp. DS 682]|nr:hypothetical protein IL306_008524 [Fusarium sp. DS 682]